MIIHLGLELYLYHILYIMYIWQERCSYTSRLYSPRGPSPVIYLDHFYIYNIPCIYRVRGHCYAVYCIYSRALFRLRDGCGLCPPQGAGNGGHAVLGGDREEEGGAGGGGGAEFGPFWGFNSYQKLLEML